ncbi:hypothetical protein C8R44DRAFT_748237 [Mycena epipterygia]|nr:hypothetical protein C8R44DRAFT_748237 [Mycena epipterygia]
MPVFINDLYGLLMQPTPMLSMITGWLVLSIADNKALRMGHKITSDLDVVTPSEICLIIQQLAYFWQFGMEEWKDNEHAVGEIWADLVVLILKHWSMVLLPHLASITAVLEAQGQAASCDSQTLYKLTATDLDTTAAACALWIQRMHELTSCQGSQFEEGPPVEPLQLPCRRLGRQQQQAGTEAVHPVGVQGDAGADSPYGAALDGRAHLVKDYHVNDTGTLLEAAVYKAKLMKGMQACVNLLISESLICGVRHEVEFKLRGLHRGEIINTLHGGEVGHNMFKCSHSCHRVDEPAHKRVKQIMSTAASSQAGPSGTHAMLSNQELTEKQ